MRCPFSHATRQLVRQSIVTKCKRITELSAYAYMVVIHLCTERQVKPVIDKTKRTTLKALSGLTAAAAIPPGIASASALLESDLSNPTATGTGVTMSMVSGHGRWHSVKLSNTSTRPVTIKHVYPGIVAVDGNNYNLNSIFNYGPVVIEAGQSHVAVVAKQNSALPEAEIPVGFTRRHAFSMHSEYQHFGQPKPVVTTRNFFA